MAINQNPQRFSRALLGMGILNLECSLRIFGTVDED